MNSSILTVNELTKKYYSKSVNLFNKKTSANKALDKVSFSLSPGLYGLLGPNGAGKSTLINIITGSLKRSGGSVKWNDISITRLGKKIPQNFGIYATATNFVQFFYRQAIFALYVRP